MTATPDTTIREIVATDYRTAAVFQRHGLDFCCNGCRTIGQGCRDAGADEGALLREIDAVLTRAGRRRAALRVLGRPRPHHSHRGESSRVRARGDAGAAASTRARSRRSTASATPSWRTSRGCSTRVAKEMTDHMAKEEQVLFPFIAALGRGGERRPSAPHCRRSARSAIRSGDGERAPVRRRRDGGDAPADGRVPAAGRCLRHLPRVPRRSSRPSRPTCTRTCTSRTTSSFPGRRRSESGARS